MSPFGLFCSLQTTYVNQNDDISRMAVRVCDLFGAGNGKPMNNGSQKTNWMTVTVAVLLIISVALLPLACRKKASVSNDPVSEPVEAQAAIEVVPVEPEPVIEITQMPETNVDTSIVVTGQKGSFEFIPSSPSNQAPAVIPEAQIQELIQAQQRLAAAQK
jgi:hypothetical protein